jgi:hypothetical protein
VYFVFLKSCFIQRVYPILSKLFSKKKSDRTPKGSAVDVLLSLATQWRECGERAAGRAWEWSRGALP